ncbi:MAG: type II toxin-antitoxin system VapB family antitoxin [Gammaproteobacteria bacterium]|nr:type II toxin-antitoxin system VapB family antitoxin [Gammaproteobacteria bacterium]
MKTTIEIADSLLIEARKVAIRERTTVRSLVEQGLRQVIAQRKTEKPFRLRKASFKGRGLRPTLRNATWGALRELAYEDHGE